MKSFCRFRLIRSTSTCALSRRRGPWFATHLPAFILSALVTVGSAGSGLAQTLSYFNVPGGAAWHSPTSWNGSVPGTGDPDRVAVFDPVTVNSVPHYDFNVVVSPSAPALGMFRAVGVFGTNVSLDLGGHVMSVSQYNNLENAGLIVATTPSSKADAKLTLSNGVYRLMSSQSLFIGPGTQLVVGSGATLQHTQIFPISFGSFPGGHPNAVGPAILQIDPGGRLLANILVLDTSNSPRVILNSGVISGVGGSVTQGISGNGVLIRSANTPMFSPTGTASNLASFDVPAGRYAYVHSTGAATLGATTLLSGGQITAPNGIIVADGRVLTGTGTVAGPVTGQAASIIEATGPLTLGDANSFLGFRTSGSLLVGNQNLVLQSRGFATLGALTELSGGTLTAANGISLPAGANLVGSGTVDARIAGNFGSLIGATGNLVLGSASSGTGFQHDGDLQVNEHTVTIHDSNQAVLGSQISIGSGALPGTLTVANGAYLDFGREMAGHGVVDSPNVLAKALINNGSIVGNSLSEPIELSGYVKGVGHFDNVTFSGTFSPGLSPTLLSSGSIKLDASSTLLMELGGTTRGVDYDAILSSGTLGLTGTLEVQTINGFVPQLGDSFDLFDGAIDGMFTSVLLPSPINPDWGWSTNQLYSHGIIELIDLTPVAATVPEPGTLVLLALGIAALVARRRRFSGVTHKRVLK